jgi:adenylate/nucleoside-diphosphate kinase
MKNCTFSQEILDMYERSKNDDIDQETLLKKVEQFDEFIRDL